MKPRAARPAARLTVTDDLPTPPLPDEMASTRVRPGISVAGGFSWARRRARAIRSFFWSEDISLVRTCTAVTPGRLPTRAVTSRCSWVRKRAAGGGQGHPHRDRAVVVDVAPQVHAEIDQVVAELGVDDAAHGAHAPASSLIGRRAGHGRQCTGVGRLARVDRLSLFKVLADPSRYAIYQEVARAEDPLSTTEIAERLDLHPNTVRLHLEKMREAGLLAVSTDRHGSVGRPQHRWAAVPQAPVARAWSRPASACSPISWPSWPPREPLDAATVAAVGRGAGAGASRPAGCLAGAAPGRRACRRSWTSSPTWASTRASSPADGETQATISFTHCPFRELAALYPDVVCQLHRGITEGILAGAVAATPGVTGRVESFASLVDADPCRVEMSV